MITAVARREPRKAMNQQHITRRSVLTTIVGAARTACGIAAAPTAAPAPSAPLSAAPADDPDLALLERRYGGRIGVRALDTRSGATVSLQGRERFLTASTAKLPLAAVLDRATTGMTVADLCDASLTVSHNTATNLPLDLLGGPTAVTAFAPGLDDATTRFDRNEPQLNVSTGPDDERDTTTPAAIVESMRAVPLGGGLQPADCERLTTSLVANTTGDATIRAGVPAGWLIGDRTGTGAQGERNDVGIVLPPDRAPLVSPSTPTRPTRSPRPATPPSPRRQRSRYGGSSVNSRHTTLGKERSWDT
ncbi:serine hydrolase [Streptomyces sp. IB2014 016-6]|uniref:serine hydrolase n=1 Tax=Streptomyces sp. IB2014 016-6 TaxID=2517818 RepID=UPI00164F9B68|nr:serine hydrolase [Streptomyces sp. IB2014 016-6]